MHLDCKIVISFIVGKVYILVSKLWGLLMTHYTYYESKNKGLPKPEAL